VFRVAAERVQPSGRVVHGPFPVRWGVLGTAFAALFVGGMLTLVGLMHERFACPSIGTCTIDDKAMFERAQIHGVRTVIETGSKNSKYGVVIVELDGGRERRLMRTTPGEASEAEAAIRRSLADGTPIDVTLHGPRIVVPFGIAGIVAFVVFGAMAFSRMGRVNMTIERGALRVRRSVLGIPLAARTFPLERVAGIVVERGTLSWVLQARYEQPIAVGRLLLIYADGAQQPLTRALYPGHALHLRAACALRAMLLLAPDTKDDAELAAIPMKTTPMGNRLAFAWGALTTGALLGMAIFGVSLALLGRISLRGNIEGWMVLGGAIPGAIAGVALVFHATRPRLPR